MSNDQLHAQVLREVVDGQHGAVENRELGERLLCQRLVPRHLVLAQSVAALVNEAFENRTKRCKRSQKKKNHTATDGIVLVIAK